MAKAIPTSPKLDQRDSQALVAQAHALAPHYVPQWNAVVDTGVGATLLTIVARFLEGIIRRLNDVPLKNFIAFLDSIGIKLLPALPARAPITFFLTKGANESAPIPAKTQIAAASPDGGDPIIFETEKTILATPAQLLSIVSVTPNEDRVIDHLARLSQNAATELFSASETNLQSHVLYLAHDDLFNVKGEAKFEVSFDSPATAAVLGRSTAPRPVWEYWGEKETNVSGEKKKLLDWYPLTVTVAGPKIILVKDDLNSEIKELKIEVEQLKQPDEAQTSERFSVNSRWIRCRIDGKLLPVDALARIDVRDLRIAARPEAARGVDPDAALYNDISLPVPPTKGKPLLPFGPKPNDDPNGSIAGTRPRQGDVFYLASKDAFSKRGAPITIKIGAIPPDAMGIDIERVLEIGPVRAARLRREGINTVVELLRRSPDDIERIIRTTGTAHTREWARNILEAAAKNFFDKVVTSAGTPVDPQRRVPQLSWEYWNGKGWLAIADVADTTNALTAAGIVTFFCPQDITPAKVVGQENFWIRARIAFGDYGQEKVTLAPPPGPGATETKVTVDSSGIRPPELASLTIEYKVEGERPQHCLTLNNLTYSKLPIPQTRRGVGSAPFVPLDEAFDSLYLGFDRAPVKGPISIFFSLQEQEYAEEGRPRVEWEYFRRSKLTATGEWARLIVGDDTRNLTESSTVELPGATDFFRLNRFGKSLFWIRAIDEGNRFTPKATTAVVSEKARRAGSIVGPVTINPCEKAIESLTDFIKFPVSRDTQTPAPVVKGIYLNTAWGIQAATIQDELLGSSDGRANQNFSLTKSPVIDESIWVDELATLTETERKSLSERKDLETKSQEDAAGKDTRFLVRWKSIEDITEAQPGTRVYAIDRTFGVVSFGDGTKHGMVPPIGRDNIRATYRAGGGSKGNVATGLIKTLRSTVPLVDSAVNREPAGGGSDTEPIEKALERGPQVLKNRRRAVTNEDYEWLAKQASQAILRAKCLPTFNDRGKYKTGWVTVIIIPNSTDPRPVPSPQLRQRVERYLLDHAPNVAAFPRQVKVIPPAYVAVRVVADVFPLSIDLAPQVESAALSTLQKFLHPLTGGYENAGWELGRFPCLSDFYRLLEEIDGVDHVENLSLSLQPTTLLGDFTGTPVVVTEDRPVDVTAPAFALVYSGEHKITVKDG